MPLPAQFENKGVDFHRHDATSTVAECRGHVIAHAGAKHQHCRRLRVEMIRKVIGIPLDRLVLEKLRMRGHKLRGEIEDLLIPTVIGI